MKRILISLLASASFTILTGHAQEESSLLTKYRSMALEYNQDIGAAEKNIALSKELEKSARADFKPKLAAGANFNHTGNPMELSLDIPSWTHPLEFQGKNISYGASLSLVQPIYAGGRIKESVKMAQKEHNLALNQWQAIKSDLWYETDFRYWNAVARQEMIAVASASQLAVQELVKIVRERVEVNLVSRNDLLMAEVKLNEAAYRLMQAQTDFEVGRMSLNSLIGTDLKTATPIDSCVPPLRSVGSLLTEINGVGTNRAEVRMAQDKIYLQESARKLKDSQFKPQLYVGAEGNYSSPGYNFKSDLDPNYLLYAKLNIPLFEWGKRKSEKRASGYRIEMAKENYNKVNDKVKLEVQSAYYTYKQSVDQVLLTENSLAKAAENERMAMERYKEGSVSILEVLDAQIYHQTAQLNSVQSRMNAQVYRSGFIRALGLDSF